jgi:hypothetical protein
MAILEMIEAVFVQPVDVCRAHFDMQRHGFVAVQEHGHFIPPDLTNRWSQPRAALLSSFIFISFLQFATCRALARGGSAPSR